jgi:hypothetical protein
MTVLPFLKPPQVVILYLQAPRERYWGVVRAIDATGVVIQGGELGGFDAWMRQVAEGAPNSVPSTVFFPLARVEKVLVDSPSGDAPSLGQQFERRIGRTLAAFLEG